jgi:large subunit ribosomal protein L10
MFSDTVNEPAKLIKEFRKTEEKPILKAAFVEESFYIGDSQLDALISIKTKNEVIGEIIGLLQSPAKNVLSALQSGGGKIAGIVKTLSERNA